jgi:hypothetical protein
LWGLREFAGRGACSGQEKGREGESHCAVGLLFTFTVRAFWTAFVSCSCTHASVKLLIVLDAGVTSDCFRQFVRRSP